jgi:hypothetical protein
VLLLIVHAWQRLHLVSQLLHAYMQTHLATTAHAGSHMQPALTLSCLLGTAYAKGYKGRAFAGNALRTSAHCAAGTLTYHHHLQE